MNDNIPLLRDIAKELNKLTPYSFSVRTDKHGNSTVCAKGTERDFGFYIREGGYGNEGKISVSYDRPYGLDGRYVELWSKEPHGGKLHDPSMKCSATKTPAQIAKDIVRRIFNDSLKLHQLVLETIAERSAYLTHQEVIAHQISEAAGVKMPEKNGERYVIDPYDVLPLARSDYRAGYGEIIVSGSSVDIKLNSVPPRLAAKIVTMIRETLINHIT